MKRNVLAWLTGEVEQARHAIILTHNINFLFVQGVLTPRLRWAGNPRLTIFADAASAASSWRQDRALLDGLGVRYRVVPVDLGPYRRFHPKVLLLANRERAAIAVGSGNLTHGGMAANHEAWAFGVSGGEGAGLIAGFRDYIDGLLARLPLAEPLREAIDVVFETDQAWAADLPTPAGLIGSPAPRPLLDRIADGITGPVRAVSVISPYHDPDGAALTAIAARFDAPVTCWVQQGREGLSRPAAEKLPPSVTLRTLRTQGEHQSFIHAKVLAFHRDADVVLVVGSANCSRAALLADDTWGNAELVAMDVVSPAAWDELFAELEPCDTPPKLPEASPSEDWEDQTAVTLKVLAARQDIGVLQVAFQAAVPLAELRVEAEEAAWPVVAEDLARGVARLAAPLRVKTLRLVGTTVGGDLVESADAWVDDEGSLSEPATFRRLTRRLFDPEAGLQNPSDDYNGVLELFRDYIRDPEARRRQLRGKHDDAAPPRPYDPAAVFSDSFGSAATLFSARGPAHSADSDADVLAIIRTLFNLRREAPPPPPPREPDDPDIDPETGEAEPPAEVEPLKPPEPPSEKTKARLRRTLQTVEQALCEPAFVLSRTPGLLGRDLALAAVLLVKGLAEQHLDLDAFRAATRALWASLFFGEKGAADGSVLRRLRDLDGAARDTFVADISSPQLSAALALWGYTEWTASDPGAAGFRFAAAELAECAPWLFAGGEPESILTELETLVTALRLPDNDRIAAPRSWTDIVRAGHALGALRGALQTGAHGAFQAATRSSWLESADLVWAGRALAFPISRIRRDPGANIPVRLLGATVDSKFRGSHVFPVRELLEAGVLDFPLGGQADIFRLLGDVAAVRAGISA
jgi:hypothetical protein